MRFNTLSFAFVIIILLSVCSSNRRDDIMPSIGPQTEIVLMKDYQEIRFVSASIGSDPNGDGSKERPWQSINFACSQINDAAANKRYAVLVSAGNYSSETIGMHEFVDLYGGFEPATWRRDIFKFRTLLIGVSNRRIMIGANHARIDGFVITKVQFRGRGAGIWCDHVSPMITNNIFVHNKTLAPIHWNPKYRHQIAHDGGAIYCENGASPIIENNIFTANETEVGRGAAIAFHKNCRGRIANNLFMDNQSGLNDPMRSSDGGAVSIFDWSSPIIENNVFLNNQASAENDAGALFVALWSSPIISNNRFVGNECKDDAGALFVGGQEHRYDQPLDPLPDKDKFFVQITDNWFIGNQNPSKNSGAMRFTMESRGLFKNNIVAHNSGIYFQRCEIDIEHNIILDDFQLVETKQSLQVSTIKHNIIWGEFHLGTAAIVSGNNLKEKITSNISVTPHFINDWIEIKAEGVCYNPKKFMTNVFASNLNLKTNELVNRIVKITDRWGVVKSNTSNHIEIWGDFSGNINFTVLPTFRIR